MKIQAAITESAGHAFAIGPAELDEPRADELLVRVVACGVCQTDSHARDQHLPVPLPAVLGHEGAGVVERVGSAVSGFAPGDHVVMSYRSCGVCRCCLIGEVAYCAQIFPLNFGGARADGSTAIRRGADADAAPIHGQFFGQSSFASHAVVNQQNAVKVPEDIPLEMLAPFGCGFQTGFGAVVKSLRVTPGSSIAIIGTGAVGLAAVMAAKIAGASTIIGLDINDDRLALALELGATHSVNTAGTDIVSAIQAIVPGGVNYVLEITGIPALAAASVDMLAPLGIAGLIGSVAPGTTAPFNVLNLMMGRTVRGISNGDAVSKVMIPMMIEEFKAGRFAVDRLIKVYPFEAINAAFDDARSGITVKPVLSLAPT